MPRRHCHRSLVSGGLHGVVTGGWRTADGEESESAERKSPMSFSFTVRCPPSASHHSVVAFYDLLLDLGNRARRVQILRTSFRAVHDRVTAIKPEWIFQVI